MNVLSALLILSIMSVLWVLSARDISRGLSFGTFVAVSSTTFLRFELPEPLPDLTIQRLILLSLLAFSLPNPDFRERVRQGVLTKAFAVWFWLNLVSLLGSGGMVASLKSFSNHVVEVLCIYLVLTGNIRTREQALSLVRSVCLGLVVVAMVAMVERHTSFNPVDAFIPGYSRDPALSRDVMATYQHRILLGTAMAMGWPIAMAIGQASNRFRGNLFWWMSVCCLVAACYFAMSRGPWLAAFLGGGVLWWFGGRTFRKPLLLLAFAGLLVLAARPGIWTSLTFRARDTLDSESFKGGTYLYRLELWKIAGVEISKNPWRFLFGYGQRVSQTRELEWTVSYRDSDRQIQSWDNHFALFLYETGALGLLAALCVYGGVPWRILKHLRDQPTSDTLFLVAILASQTVFLFMMTNVLIYGAQLYYAFWALAGSGLALRSETETASAHGAEAFKDLGAVPRGASPSR